MTDAAERCAAMLAEAFPQGGHWTAQDIDAVLARDGGYLFENDGGFLVVSAVLDEAEIWTIAIRPEMRRQGHARRLLCQAIEKLSENGIERLFLEVARDNGPARALYVSLGFRETGRRRGYYRRSDGGRTDAIMMSLETGK